MTPDTCEATPEAREVRRANQGLRGPRGPRGPRAPSRRIQTLRASGAGLLRGLTSDIDRRKLLIFDVESKDVPRDEHGKLLKYVDVPKLDKNGKPVVVGAGSGGEGDGLTLFDRFFVDEDGCCQHEGFARATHLGFYDGVRYVAYKNLKPKPGHRDPLLRFEPEERARQKGGCVDRFMRHVTGDNPAYRSNVAEWYGHNAGRFDSTFLMAWLILHKDEFDAQFTSIHGRIQQIVCWKKNSGYDPNAKVRAEHLSWTFRDSALILPMSLAEACQTFNKTGIQKDVDFDRNMHEDDSRWYSYNRDDCRGLYGALNTYGDMLESIGGEIGMTAPATAMKLFRRTFMGNTGPISIHRHFPDCDGKCHRTGHGPKKDACSRLRHCDGKCHGCLHDWIRTGYFGGRTEIHHRFGEKGTFYFDENSAYPAAMLKAMPVGDAKIIQGKALYDEMHEGLAKNHVGFVECVVFIPKECPIPPLPALKNGKLMFETGYVAGVFEYDELQLIFDPAVGGHIVSVEKSVWYRKRFIFKDFVETLYDYRKSHEWVSGRDVEASMRAGTLFERYGGPRIPGEDKKQLDDGSWDFGTYLERQGYSKAFSELAKLLMNSLYGKFAMAEEREELVLFDPTGPGRFPDGDPLDGQHDTCPIWKSPRFIEPRYIIPQISARITALARKALWLVMRDILYPPEGSCRRKDAIREERWTWTSGMTSAPSAYEILRDPIAQVIYLDTDSVMTNLNLALYSEFDVGGTYDYKLGAWKREHPGKVLRVEAVLPKSYAMELFDEKTGEPAEYKKTGTNVIVKMKGIPRGKCTRETFDHLRGPGEWGDARRRQGGDLGFTRVAQHRTVIRKSWGGPRQVFASKSMKTQYDKRIMDASGATRPHHNAEPPTPKVPITRAA